MMSTVHFFFACMSGICGFGFLLSAAISFQQLGAERLKGTSVLQAEEPFDMPGEVLVNFGVSGHRLPAPVGRVPVEVVP